MPRNATTPVCGSMKVDCYNQAEDELLQGSNDNDTLACKCLPSCESISYDSEISQAELDVDNFIAAANLNEGTTPCVFLMVEIKFHN